MALITSQQLSNYYNTYLNIDVTFTKDVIRVIQLRHDQTFLRAIGYQWPCIIYSSSMAGAKVIANVGSDLKLKIQEANNLVSLRFCFNQPEKVDPLAFFVSGRATDFTTYSDSHPDLNFITLNYTQRPSDDLIAVLGTLLEANINAKHRKEERIDINPETIRKLGLASKNGTLFVDEVPRKCIVRDLSFSGALVLVTGVAKFLLDREIKLKLDIADNEQTIILSGKIVRFDEYPDRRGIGSVGLLFHENGVSMEYKLLLNDYLTTARKPG